MADIGLHEGVAGVGGDAGQRIEVAGIGELVEIDDAVGGWASNSRTTAEPIKPAPPVTRKVFGWIDMIFAFPT